MSLETLYAREELEAEFNARQDYLAELRAEHFDPCAGHEDEDKPAPSIQLEWDLNPNLADDLPWLDY